MDVTREQALRHRWRRQGLDAEPGSVALADVPTLDLGVQDGANDAALVGLLARGVDAARARAATSATDDELVLVWSLRGAPHHYRRADLPGVLDALSPFSEADAARRVVSAGKDLRAAGHDVRDALVEVARAMRKTVREPTVKGDVSAALREALPDHLQTPCRPCGCVHAYEMLFRLAPLFAGLELEPGTSPPVLSRSPSLPSRRSVGLGDPASAPPRLDVVRGYLRFLGPAAPKDVAAFLDAPTRDVSAAWPGEALEVRRAGQKAWILPGDAADLQAAAEPDGEPRVRLLSGFDLLLAARDRPPLVPDRARQKELWPVLGRPGAVVAEGEVLGTWRPKSGRGGLTLRVRPWRRWPRATREAVGEQAALLAAARGQGLAAVVDDEG